MAEPLPGLWSRLLAGAGALALALPRPLWALVAVGWAGFGWFLSSRPGEDLPSSFLWSWAGNLAHAPLFGLLALWLALAAPRRPASGERGRAEVEGLCLRCHAPAAHHHDRLMGLPARSMEALTADGAALDGVTCTVCHRMTGEGLGTPATFEGFPPHDLEARLYGPYPDPATGPMRVHTG